MSRWIRRCIMMAPVAEMTYFDSGTIEHLTYCVVAAKEYSDGSVGGGRSFRCYTRTRNTPRERRRGSSISSRCHGLVAASRQFRERAFSSARVPVAANRAYLIAPFRTYSSSKTSNCLETRRGPQRRKTLGGSESSGRVIDHSDELARAETKDGSFTRSWDGHAETRNVDARNYEAGFYYRDFFLTWTYMEKFRHRLHG